MGIKKDEIALILQGTIIDIVQGWNAEEAIQMLADSMGKSYLPEYGVFVRKEGLNAISRLNEETMRACEGKVAEVFGIEPVERCGKDG